MNLGSKVIVITGASAGLGAGMASWFADQGAALGLCARRTPAASGERTVAMSVDVTDAGRLREFATSVSARLGPIDLWINNAAALGPITPQRSLSYEDLEDHFAVNVGGVLNGTQAFLERLDADEHRGALVNISSGLARKGLAGVSAYSAAKAAVDRLTEVVAAEEPDVLTMALAVSPGIVETGMQVALRDEDASVLHDVGMFREFKEEGSMNSPAWVAEHIAAWVFGESVPDGVIVRTPREND